MENFPIDRCKIASAAKTLEEEIRGLKARQDSARSGILIGKILTLVGLGGYVLSSVLLLLPVGFFGVLIYFYGRNCSACLIDPQITQIFAEKNP
ncbi:MAG: hypothetical protein NZM11_00480 [Anaerolineales bacterium]|nr:hypothetical protein [Anaerolineales bacterium]